MKIIQGKCKDPKPDNLYVIFRCTDAGKSVGIVIRGDDANWQSREIVAHVELPIQMNAAEAMSFKRTGRFPLDFEQDTRMVTLRQLRLFLGYERGNAESTNKMVKRIIDEGFADDVPEIVRSAMIGWAKARPGRSAAAFWDAAIVSMSSEHTDI